MLHNTKKDAFNKKGGWGGGTKTLPLYIGQSKQYRIGLIYKYCEYQLQSLPNPFTKPGASHIKCFSDIIKHKNGIFDPKKKSLIFFYAFLFLMPPFNFTYIYRLKKTTITSRHFFITLWGVSIKKLQESVRKNIL